jgi:hypothetical protein
MVRQQLSFDASPAPDSLREGIAAGGGRPETTFSAQARKHFVSETLSDFSASFGSSPGTCMLKTSSVAVICAMKSRNCSATRFVRSTARTD